VLRDLLSSCRKGEGRQFNVYLSREVARLLYEEEKSSIEYLETSFGTKITIIANPAFAIDTFQVEGVY
jgi:hypothetical protein